jgi:23S rRNA (pseudouridine1915-N3)-methyltransferase
MAKATIRILTVGRARESWLKAALEHYTVRTRPYLKIDWVEVESEIPLLRAAKEGAWGLDPAGRVTDSESFSQILYSELVKKEVVTLLVGGPDGFSQELRATLKEERMLSLSRMTMTHQVVRIMLAEQLYRAALIQIGHPYHRS